MVYDARVVLVEAGGERIVSLEEFFTGYRKNVMRSGELISEIVLPPPRFTPGEQYYRKVGTRQAQAISKVVVAGAWNRKEGMVRLAWGSVAPVSVRAKKTEAPWPKGPRKRSLGSAAERDRSD
jgi:CO/xanthine dehydrogenase FAD-binding subunit